MKTHLGEAFTRGKKDIRSPSNTFFSPGSTEAPGSSVT
jgi:hypothetical protein